MSKKLNKQFRLLFAPLFFFWLFIFNDGLNITHKRWKREQQKKNKRSNNLEMYTVAKYTCVCV